MKILDGAFLGLLALGARQSSDEQLEVVTTLSFLKDLAEAVGGEHVHAQSLSDPRQDPHYVEPKPTLMQKARAADLFIEVGLQLELWSEKVVAGSGNPKIQSGQPGRVIATRGVQALEQPSVLSREWGDVHPYGNPHVWLDPLNAKTMAENVADAFALLVTNESSLRDLNSRLDRPLPMARFRPNLVLEGLEPFAEDDIDLIRLGNIELRCVKACLRCVVTTTDQMTGQREGNEPLRTLKKYRWRSMGGVAFGVNAIVLKGEDPLPLDELAAISESWLPKYMAGEL